MKTTGKSMFVTWAVGLSATLLAGCPSKEAEYVDDTPATNTAPPPPTNTIATSGGCDQLSMASAMSILASRAATEAKDMAPEGSISCGNVAQGGTWQGQSVVLQPGYCYTILAQGLPNVTEIDITLMADATAMGFPIQAGPFTAVPLLVDNSSGNAAMAGPCYKFPLGALSVPAKVMLRARGGYGPVAAQVYRRPG
ncbi:MAG: hypothetical protein U0271_16680 [Polyangiaceae bacterium]